MCQPNVRFEASFRLLPRAAFGLSDQETVVIPREPGTGGFRYESGAFDAETLQQVTPGTQSRFRSPAQTLSVDLRLPTGTATIRDDFLVLTFEAEDMPAAQATASAAANSFLRRLTLTSATTFHRTGNKIRSESGQVLPLFPKAQAKLVVYDLATLAANVKEAERLSELSDPVFERAILYFQHSCLLQARLDSLTDGFRSHIGLVYSSIFLNLYKSITVITGDQMRGDSPMDRASLLGLGGDFYDLRIRPLLRARHNLDVAHYNLDPEAIGQAFNLFRGGTDTAQSVIRTYANYLSKGGVPSTPPEDATDVPESSARS